jgi:GntR family transcriptional regulator
VAPLPIQLSQASGVPYYRQVVDQVSDLIRSGRLDPDARMPSVRELASQLLVSLITIRRAYADLEAAGLIVRRQGQGTFVASRVDRAAVEKARADARRVLADALATARRLGLDDEELRETLEELLDAERNPAAPGGDSP